MNRQLAAFHHDFTYFEQPGAGHWWDASDEPGADCVDWAPMFDFFAHHVLPPLESVRQVDFATADPGVSARCRWLVIEAQTHPLKVSTVSVRCDPGQRRFAGKTENVARLCLTLDPLTAGMPLKVELDGQKIENIAWPAEGELWLARDAGNWKVIQKPPRTQKYPGRCGPFKAAFRNRMLFVYGTKGTPEENAWAFAKARYDAEVFWYRGNGSVDLVRDVEFDAGKERDRSVILYGNADTNAAWNILLPNSPIVAKRGQMRVGDRTLNADNLACLFVRPRPNSDIASVGVVSGSGMTGMRLTDRLPVFVSGVAYPDWTLLSPDMLTQGAKGLLACGFFGQDWGLTTGESAWQP
jgi:hypothetical protein